MARQASKKWSKSGELREIALQCDILRPPGRQTFDAKISPSEEMITRDFQVVRIAHHRDNAVELCQRSVEPDERVACLREVLVANARNAVDTCYGGNAQQEFFQGCLDAHHSRDS